MRIVLHEFQFPLYIYVLCIVILNKQIFIYVLSNARSEILPKSLNLREVEYVFVMKMLNFYQEYLHNKTTHYCHQKGYFQETNISWVWHIPKFPLESFDTSFDNFANQT